MYQHLINGNDHRLNIDSMMIAVIRLILCIHTRDNNKLKKFKQCQFKKSTELNKINITILVSEQAKMLDINCYHNDNVTQRQVHFCCTVFLCLISAFFVQIMF